MYVNKISYREMERSLEQKKKKYETYGEKYICRDNAN